MKILIIAATVSALAVPGYTQKSCSELVPEGFPRFARRQGEVVLVTMRTFREPMVCVPIHKVWRKWILSA